MRLFWAASGLQMAVNFRKTIYVNCFSSRFDGLPGISEGGLGQAPV